MVRVTQGGNPIENADEQKPDASLSVSDRVAMVIDRIRPAVQNDGGDIELVEVTPAGVVRIRMHGACVGCPSSNMTLRLGIEQNLKTYVPEVSGVEAIEEA
ncbi:MAG: NifU family protein [Phycisphaerales bacterium]|nr:NifU family protein [Phycisphaerales bacterium]